MPMAGRAVTASLLLRQKKAKSLARKKGEPPHEEKIRQKPREMIPQRPSYTGWRQIATEDLVKSYKRQKDTSSSPASPVMTKNTPQDVGGCPKA